MESISNKTLVCLLIAILLVACYDDVAEIDDEIITVDGEEYVDGDLAGRVIDEAGNPVSGAQIKTISDNMITSSQGFFTLSGTKLRKNNALVEIRTTENLTYFHCVPVHVNDISQQVIRLIRQVDQTHAQYVDGYTIQFQQDATLTIPKDGLSLDGQSQDEPISARYYTTEGDLNSYLPTTLTDAIEKEMLSIRSVLHFNLFNNAGANILLNPALPSTLTFTKQTIQANEALYYFNPTIARWIKINHKNNAQGFSAEVVAQGYYCIGRPVSAQYIHGTVMSSGNNLPGSKLTITSSIASTDILTSAKGAFTALTPSDETLSIALVNSCQQNIVDQELNTGSSIDNILVTVPSTVDFRGQIKTCTNELAAESFLLIGDEQFIYSRTGAFDIPLIPCDDQLEVRGIETQGDQYSATVRWDSDDENHIQSLFLCPQAKENYIMLSVDDDVQFYNMTSSSIIGDRLYIQATNMDDDEFEFLLKISASEKGSVADMDLNIVFKDRNLGNEGYSMYCPNSTVGCGFETFELTHYGVSNGDYITGAFEGKFFVLTTNNSPQLAYNKRINGEFRILRNF